MTAQEIKTLSSEEKVRIMEVIWEDMRERYEKTPDSPELIELLHERRARAESGEAKILEWDKIKASIGRG